MAAHIILQEGINGIQGAAGLSAGKDEIPAYGSDDQAFCAEPFDRKPGIGQFRCIWTYQDAPDSGIAFSDDWEFGPGNFLEEETQLGGGVANGLGRVVRYDNGCRGRSVPGDLDCQRGLAGHAGYKQAPEQDCHAPASV
jgi:hypothetical protein